MQRNHFQTQLALPLLLAASLIGCSQRPEATGHDTQDIVHQRQEHGVSITLTLSPGTIDPRTDALLSLHTRFPAGLHIDFPDPAAALEGFTVAAVLSPPDVHDQTGHRTRETILRITPIPGSAYRIAPMLFSITPDADEQQEPLYIITPAIRPAVRRVATATDADLATQPEPLYIPPTPTEIMRAVGLVLLVALVIIALYFSGRRIRRRIQIMMMSPAQRARYELQLLLQQHLPDKGLYKEFYFAITGIIRTYIERRHGIRAPELTTPEFLQAAAKRPAFEPTVVERLRLFLESADLVKFAAWTPTKRAVQDTISTARDYIDQDEPETTAKEN